MSAREPKPRPIWSNWCLALLILVSVTASYAAIARFPNLVRWIDLLPIAGGQAGRMLLALLLAFLVCCVLGVIQNVRGARSGAVFGGATMLLPLVLGLELVASDDWAVGSVRCVVPPCPPLRLPETSIDEGRLMGLLLLILFVVGAAVATHAWAKRSGTPRPAAPVA